MENENSTTPNPKPLDVHLRPPTDVTLTFVDALGSFGFRVAQLLASALIFNENPVDRKNFNSIYEILNEYDKKQIDSWITSMKSNPQVIEKIEQINKMREAKNKQ